MNYLEAEPSSANSTGNLPSSSSSVASRLYMNGTQRSSRKNSFSSEPELMNFSDDGNNFGFNDVSNQMSTLTKKLTDMQELHMATNEEKARLRTENAVLQERIHLLEEQFQNSEQRWTEKVEEEKQRNRELQSRFEREKQLEAESGSLRCQMLEKDLSALKKERDRLEDSCREMQRKVSQLRDQLSEAQQEGERHEAEKKQVKIEFERYRRDATDRMENSSEILEELTRQSELNHLKHGSLQHQGSLTDQIIILEDEIERLRLDNRDLREHNTDLQAQLLHDQVECGRNLLADGPPSLAAELTGMDSQGLMNTLKEQEIVNQRLRNYVNGILMRIIERHPDILEIGGEIKEEEFTESVTSDSASSCAASSS